MTTRVTFLTEKKRKKLKNKSKLKEPFKNINFSHFTVQK